MSTAHRTIPLVLFLALLAVQPRTLVRGATFTVDRAADHGDSNPGDGVCFTTLAGGCTLRAAIEEANALSGRDRIEFALPGSGLQTIEPLEPLPYLIEDVVIDGWTQGGAGYRGLPLVELDGSRADDLEEWENATVHGIYVRSGSAVIRGLAFDDWDVSILLQNTGGSVVEGCHVQSQDTGILIERSPDNTIGGRLDRDANVISGNQVGVRIIGEESTGNLVRGNYVGHDLQSSTSIRWNAVAGIEIGEGASNNIIGAEAFEGRNVITGNQDGVLISSGAHNNWVRGNLFGTEADGAYHGSNTQAVSIVGARDNVIGGSTPGDRNLIAGSVVGVSIRGGQSTGNAVLGNFIGTDITGARALAPELGEYVGIRIYRGAHHNTVGSGSAAGRNVISGNDTGIAVEEGAHDNVIAGNYIGTDVSGAREVGNSGDGIRISDAHANRIGGSTKGERNVISGNGTGISLLGEGSQGNSILGCHIGTDADGASALPNGYGIFLASASRNSIGSGEQGQGNVISGNTLTGINLAMGSDANLVRGNRIGTDARGAELGNGSAGVRIVASGDNRIGTLQPGEGNTIAFNQGGGVILFENAVPGSTNGNAIRGNSIASNTGLGIGLDNQLDARANDPQDADTGANNWQNFPELASATTFESTTVVEGRLTSLPAASFHVDVYASTECDSSGHGEGERYLGSLTVTTGDDGNATFRMEIESAVAPGLFVTAAAVNQGTLDTSEHSACVEVVAAPVEANARQVPGDCNQDGRLDISDASCLLGHLFQGSPDRLPCGDGSGADPANAALFDWQPDGRIDISEAVAMLSFLFGGGAPHPLAVAGDEARGCVEIPGCPDVPACAAE